MTDTAVVKKNLNEYQDYLFIREISVSVAAELRKEDPAGILYMKLYKVQSLAKLFAFPRTF